MSLYGYRPNNANGTRQALSVQMLTRDAVERRVNIVIPAIAEAHG
jgi:hypothetical protein